MLAATRGEYRGTGRTARDQRNSNDQAGGGVIAFVIFGIVILSLIRAASRRSSVYGRRGLVTPWISTGGWGGGSSGGSSGSGGSFSGGGGSFGGGGAGGNW
jgi:uncharacterized protein